MNLKAKKNRQLCSLLSGKLSSLIVGSEVGRELLMPCLLRGALKKQALALTMQISKQENTGQEALTETQLTGTNVPGAITSTV